MQKKKLVVLWICLIIGSVSLSASGSFQMPDDQEGADSFDSSDLIHVVRLSESFENQVLIKDYDFEIVSIKKDDYIDIFATDDDLSYFNELGIEYTMQVQNVDRLFDESRGEYYSYPEVVDFLQNIATNYPSITSLYSIGKSWEGRDIWCLEITDNPGVDEGEPGIFFMGLHHAREWPTINICLYIADNLTSHYGNDPEITDIIDNRRIWIVACENPDGYVYSHDQGHNMWRKNRRYLPEFSSYGIDANRNYGGSCNGNPWGSWGSIGIGSVSHDPDDDTYCGPWSMSENCTQAIKDMYIQNKIDASISWHTYSELVLWPWGYSTTDVTPDDTYISQVGIEIASRITQQDGTGTYTPDQSSGLYPTTGDTTDWAYGYKYYVQGEPHFAYTIEACTSFFPSESYLDQICEENYDGAFYLLQEAENISNVIPQVIPPVIDEMTTDTDGQYTVSWTETNPGANPAYFQLDELRNLSISMDTAEIGSSLWDMDGFSRSSTRSYGGSYSFKSRYSNGDVSSMVSSYPVPVTDDMMLSFWSWYEIESNFDMAFVEVSTDGRSFTLLDTFTGDSAGWEYHEYDLNSWVGQSVYIRFRYTTDTYTQDEGFYVDNISPLADVESVVTLSNSIPSHSYTITGNTPGMYYYRVKGYNNERGWGDFSFLEGMNVTGSSDAIVFSDLHAQPRRQNMPGWVNLSATISSAHSLSTVKATITHPDGSISNQSMSTTDHSCYYLNRSFMQTGSYEYYLWAEDTLANHEKSYSYFFYIGQNYTDMVMKQGWNLLGLPVQNNWMASDLASNITASLSVSGWNAALQTYDTYIVGGPPSFDFVLSDGHGYFVDVMVNSTFSVTGSAITNVSVPLETGWNLLGWYKDENTTASSLAGNITGCSSVSSWNATIQSYDTYIVGGPDTFDFVITSGMGVFVDVAQPSIWYGQG